MTPAPGLAHQRTMVELTTTLRQYLEQHKLGEVLVAPFEVALTDNLPSPALQRRFTPPAAA